MRRDLQRWTFFISVLIFSFSIGFSQAPAGYYSPAQGKTGDELKAALHTIIKGHKTFPYTSSSTDVWDILKLSDRDPKNPANVILFYTGWSVNAAQEYNNGAGWNREHVWAKSHGPFSEDTQGPGTDCHHLRPADISVNSARNNRYFDYADKEYIDGGVPTGCKTSSTRDVWEPRDGQKGDVAREIFYMATRYEGEDGFPDLEVVDYIPTNDASPLFGVLSTLIEWNQLDPVDSFEMNRNNVVYSFQKNRNPFIDHPEYVNMIWAPGVLPVNKLPQIANITYSPTTPTSADILQFSASATDSDGTVDSVKFYWGTSAGNLSNNSIMQSVNGKYSVDIVPQPAGTKIYFVITAWDNSKDQTSSDEQSFVITELPNILPEIATVTFAPLLPSSADELEITAEASDSDGTIASVKLFWGTSPGNLQNSSDMQYSVGHYSASINPQPAGTEIFFDIKVWDNKNDMTVSEVQSFTVSAASGVEATMNTTGFLYPNPAQSSVTVKHATGESVIFYTTDGRQVLSTHDRTIDISSMKKGLYMVHVTDANGNVRKVYKLVKE